jgi:hypothetical protein
MVMAIGNEQRQVDRPKQPRSCRVDIAGRRLLAQGVPSRPTLGYWSSAVSASLVLSPRGGDPSTGRCQGAATKATRRRWQ